MNISIAVNWSFLKDADFYDVPSLFESQRRCRPLGKKEEEEEETLAEKD